MKLRLWLKRRRRPPRLCSTCQQAFDAPPCCKGPEGQSGHTSAGGAGDPYTLYDVAEPAVDHYERKSKR